ncbi:TatD family deoxyribonuclease [Mariprofundus erugo]|uniref:TatD family deoxyribonuclease n=1 Tax=Mariprofundus erugo TaxID=2528639 RepID=A0A5R9GPN6_9PROT|nr:TatD family hydrolase [Mariprofundus erugo]TLS67025.1 TatD family deoxyribonuclease [Mariprofundus erugo]
MQLIDSHCHLDDPRFDADRAAVMARAAAVGVSHLVVPAVAFDGWQKLRALAAADGRISPAYGLHPWFCAQHDQAHLDALPAFLAEAVAVGECGLDGGRDLQAEQLYWFAAQLDVAVAMDLPVIVHAHKALDEVCREIRRRPALRGVIHGFAGSRQQADHLLAQGFYLGIGSAVTRPQNRCLHQIVAAIPAERLLIETDAPDQPPAAHRGARNEPAFLLEIVEQIATLRGVDTAVFADRCNRNARELFKL